MTDNPRIHRLRVAWEDHDSLFLKKVYVEPDDLKYALDQLDKLHQAIEDFTPSSESDAEWKDEALSD
jgi:hypothetical protein